LIKLTSGTTNLAVPAQISLLAESLIPVISPLYYLKPVIVLLHSAPTQGPVSGNISS